MPAEIQALLSYKHIPFSIKINDRRNIINTLFSLPTYTRDTIDAGRTTLTTVDLHNRTTKCMITLLAERASETPVPFLRKCYHEIVDLLDAYKKPGTFPRDNDTYFIEVNNIISEWVINKISHLFTRTFSSRFSLCEEDFAIAGFGRDVHKRYISLPKAIKCAHFAFYHLHETRLFPHIFNFTEEMTGEPPDELFNDTTNLLKEYGYDCVKDALPGDLIVYFVVHLYDHTRERASHFAIYNDAKNNTAVSKFGSYRPILEHHIYDVFPGYGNLFRFYRKKDKTPLKQEFLEDLNSAKDALEDFSHEACRSPITPKGTRLFFRRFFSEEGGKHLSKVMRDSLYGRRYHLITREALAEKILSMEEGGSIADTIEKLQRCVVDVFDMIISFEE
jgi:hypothetical protein